MTEGNNMKKCRTCWKGSRGFQQLSKLITEKQDETKSFADFLTDITNIDVRENYNHHIHIYNFLK